MKKIFAYILVTVMVTGLLAGCSKDKESQDNVNTAPTEQAAKNGEKSEETPTSGASSASVTEPVTEPAGAAAEPTGAATESDGTASEVQSGDSTGIQAAADDGKNSELWKNTAAMYSDFISGDVWANGLDRLCEYFYDTTFYSLEEIVIRYGKYLNDIFYDIELTSAGYSLIRSTVPDKPNLVVSLTYESVDGFDSPHYENLVFTEVGGNLTFVTDVSSYYRSDGILNDFGYYYYTGSMGASSYGQSYYFINASGEDTFLYSLTGELCLSEPAIPNYYLPEDASSLVMGEEFEAYGDGDYEMDIYSFERYNEGVYSYDEYLHRAYYTFTGPDGNSVMPDADYLAKCDAEGIKVVSADEIEKLIKEKHAEYGITDEMINAPMVSDWTELDISFYADAKAASDEQGELWNETVNNYMRFLNGKTKAYSLGLLCSSFTENDVYDLKFILETYRAYLEERDEVELELTSTAIAFIEGRVPGKPLLVLRVTYETPGGFDAPYVENMIFEFDEPCVGFIGNYETCYRTYTNIGTRGYIEIVGSNSAMGYQTDNYYIDSIADDINYSKFLYTVSQTFTLAEMKIPNSELPTDSALWQDEELRYESGMSYELERFSFTYFWYVPDEEEYNRYLRKSVYIFYDEEGNWVEPDAEYAKACAEDGIILISEDELIERIQQIYDACGITEEIIWARYLEDEDFILYEID